MLFLFVLSVTPKQLLHDVITGHKHSVINYDVVNFQAAKNNFQCNWHNDAVESPFTDQPAFQFDYSRSFFISYDDFYTQGFCYTEDFTFALRGPPSRA